MDNAILLIGEPWDFELPGKGNKITGEIKPINVFRSDGNKIHVLMLPDPPFMWENTQISKLLLRVRYTTESTQDILNGKKVTVNISYFDSKNLFNEDEIESNNFIFFAIGTVQILPPRITKQ
jgi:hypothetical protein